MIVSVSVEVREPAEPWTLLGYLPVEQSLLGHCYHVSFPIVRRRTHTRPPGQRVSLFDNVERVQLSVQRFANRGFKYFALNADGTPIETLRCIPGFKEVKRS